MAQLLTISLSAACWIAGALFLGAALGKKRLIRLSPKQHHMSGLLHVWAALLFFGVTLFMYPRLMTWPVAAVYGAITAASVVYGCMVDRRARRHNEAG
jgi:hypothetical protein